MPPFQYYLRKTQLSKSKPIKLIYKLLFVYWRQKYHIEISDKIDLKGGAYFGHPFNITINPNTIIGSNVNIHKGVTIGQENRGQRKGTPIIGDNVWIGVNATIVGAIKVGDDVLIAPNAYVNFDVPEHSIVIGNPAEIHHKEWATEGYINNCINNYK